jgi:hypothetical protein
MRIASICTKGRREDVGKIHFMLIRQFYNATFLLWSHFSLVLMVHQTRIVRVAHIAAKHVKAIHLKFHSSSVAADTS